MIFNEDEVFDRNLEKLKDEIKGIKLDDLAKLLSNLDVTKSPQQTDTNDAQSDALTDDFVLQISGTHRNGEIEESVEDVDANGIVEAADLISPHMGGEIGANQKLPFGR